MDIGRRLKIARETIGYTQKRASEESQIGESSISAFENSEREPKFSQLSKLAEVYRKKVEFFLKDEPIVRNVLLWRNKPNTEEERKKTEAEFKQLCEQYRDLEVLMDETKELKLPQPNITKSEEFDYLQTELFARNVQKEFSLGDVPIASLKQILEETYYVKIFYLDFSGSSISNVSEQFGLAILLNAKNKQWRRSYDLAHELFHILTWKIFRHGNTDDFVANENEEKLANAFASRLLMPEEPLRQRIQSTMNEQGQITFDQLDDIARVYDVSLVALIYRIAHIFNFGKGKTKRYHDTAEQYIKLFNPRQSYKPNKLPERYCDLAQRALREGKLSLMQFAEYMGISYRTAQEYLTDEGDFTDEKISISVT